MRHLPPLLTLLVVLLLPAASASAQTVHPLTIELETTSDHARLEFKGLVVRELKRQVDIRGPVPGHPVNGFVIKKLPFDETPIRIRVDALVVASGDAISVQVTHGDVGRTRLRLVAAGRTVLDGTAQGTNGKPENLTVYSPDPARLLAGPSPPRTDFGKRVLAFYYGWYGTPTGPAKTWLHWDQGRADRSSAQTPQLGYYDSADPKIIAQHVTWAKQAGLQGFVLSWWRKYPHQEAVLRALLAEAARQGDFTISLYLETAATPAELRAQVQDILVQYGQHAAFQRVLGRPVLFLYTRIMQDLDHRGLRTALHGLPGFYVGDLLQPSTLDVLDGAHTYVSASVPNKYQQELRETLFAARLTDRLAIATVMPGYDDTHVRKPGGIDHRLAGRFYDGEWAMAAMADWVLLTSFNEWHEGSEIEPSVEFGNQYLEATRRWITRWRN